MNLAPVSAEQTRAPRLSVTLGHVVAAMADVAHGGLFAELRGDADVRVQRIGPLETAQVGTLSFLSNPRYRSQLGATQASCVILSPAVLDDAASLPACIVTAEPYRYFAALTRWWGAQVRPRPAAGVHSSAVVSPEAVIGQGVNIGALAVVEAGAVVGDYAIIGAQCHIGERSRIGAHTRLAPQVVLGFDCVVGERCIFHGGVVIGADGFGFAPHQGRWEKVEQLGAVRIGNDVELGANTCVDRGALDDTVIDNGVKLDNLVQIAHNVHIGEHTAMAGCVGVAGSARIGKHCTVGGAGMILGHLTLADHVHVSSGTLISRSIHKPGQYSGVYPFDENANWEKNAATLRQLHALRDRIRTLEKQVKS